MDKKKYVDESWKTQAFEEKDKLTDGVAEPAVSSEKPQTHSETCSCSDHSNETSSANQQEQEIEVNFLNYITSLGFQAMIFMGEIPNPITNETEKNLPQAKFLIDTLSMLKDKTVGNLNDQESSLLENSVYELQMRYVQHIDQDGESKGEKAA